MVVRINRAAPTQRVVLKILSVAQTIGLYNGRSVQTEYKTVQYDNGLTKVENIRWFVPEIYNTKGSVVEQNEKGHKIDIKV